ncbi:hypothetical protein Anas_12178 [Armadillidium nasatum]|uniref:Uncharacterized protein n=1 Tax=Armadillidium nasatum TaxID=96803 RepID=A0A5N5T8M6_9CRUS|nr:hypothetical protein Anas_12178 [Armadillidium nasatum]
MNFSGVEEEEGTITLTGGKTTTTTTEDEVDGQVVEMDIDMVLIQDNGANKPERWLPIWYKLNDKSNMN